MTPAITDPATIRDLIASHDIWYHQVELAPGIVTPGVNASAHGLRLLDELGLPSDCEGLRVLDIGCMDGFFSFEMERRGARVVGLDYATPDYSGFGICSRVLGSTVEHRVGNVYDLAPGTHGSFDVVLFLGVLYHLRNPMLALDRIRSVMTPGARLFVETQVASDPEILDSDTPAWQYLPHDSLNADASNKWAPNLAGLAAMIRDCEFDVTATMPNGSRGYAVADAVDRSDTAYFRELDTSAGHLDGGRR